MGQDMEVMCNQSTKLSSGRKHDVVGAVFSLLSHGYAWISTFYLHILLPFIDLWLKFESCKVVYPSPINTEGYYLLPGDNLVLADFYCMWYWQS